MFTSFNIRDCVGNGSPCVRGGIGVLINKVTGKFRLPRRGIMFIARGRLFGGIAGGRPRHRGVAGTRELGDCARLGPNSCIIRMGRKVKLCANVRAVRIKNIRRSCVSVTCRRKTGLFVPIARVRLVRGCISSSTGAPGVRGLNKAR